MTLLLKLFFGTSRYKYPLFIQIPRTLQLIGGFALRKFQDTYQAICNKTCALLLNFLSITKLSIYIVLNAITIVYVCECNFDDRYAANNYITSKEYIIVSINVPVMYGIILVTGLRWKLVDCPSGARPITNIIQYFSFKV